MKTLTKDEAKAFLSNGGGKRGRKPKDWPSIIHRLMAGAPVRDVAKEFKLTPAYVVVGAKRFAKAVLSAK